jgi:hypothetical protein
MCWCFNFGFSSKPKNKSPSSNEKRRRDASAENALRGKGRVVTTNIQEKRTSKESSRKRRSTDAEVQRPPRRVRNEVDPRSQYHYGEAYQDYDQQRPALNVQVPTMWQRSVHPGAAYLPERTPRKVPFEVVGPSATPLKVLSPRKVFVLSPQEDGRSLRLHHQKHHQSAITRHWTPHRAALDLVVNIDPHSSLTQAQFHRPRNHVIVGHVRLNNKLLPRAAHDREHQTQLSDAFLTVDLRFSLRLTRRLKPYAAMPFHSHHRLRGEKGFEDTMA